MFKIFIPSKGRAPSKTAELLISQGLDFNIVVEPQDAEAYSIYGNKVIVLPENNQGIAYVRNYILGLNKDWFWMLDDDITAFYRAEGGKNVKISFASIHALEQKFSGPISDPNLAIVGLEYQQYSFRMKDEGKLNTYCEVAVCVNPKAVGRIRYDASVNGKEDRDFVLELLCNGRLSYRYLRYSFANDMGNAKGGLDYFYAKKEQLEATVIALCNKYGSEICRPIIKRNGMVDAKINWSFFKGKSQNK